MELTRRHTGIRVSPGRYLAVGAPGKLAPGESRDFTFVPIRPLRNENTARVTVCFTESGSIQPLKSRTVFCAVL